MSRNPFRRLIMILFAGAFFSASTVQAMSAGAMSAGAMSMSPAGVLSMSADMTMRVHHDTSDHAPMPCKGSTPACMNDLGCIFIVGMAVPAAALVVWRAFAPVAYLGPAGGVPDRREQAPDLRPPIRST